MYSDFDILRLYTELKEKWEKFLKSHGVKFPKLMIRDQYTKNALVLIYLYDRLGQKVTKEELTVFLSNMGYKVNDMQQGRHLGAQNGWYIISGTREDIERKKYNLKSGDYLFKTYKKPYPSFNNKRRHSELTENIWKQIKENYRIPLCYMWF